VPRPRLFQVFFSPLYDGFALSDARAEMSLGPTSLLPEMDVGPLYCEIGFPSFYDEPSAPTPEAIPTAPSHRLQIVRSLSPFPVSMLSCSRFVPPRHQIFYFFTISLPPFPPFNMNPRHGPGPPEVWLSTKLPRSFFVKSFLVE